MKAPSEHDLHAFIDGRLETERRRVVEGWLADHPERAAEIGEWRRDAQQLRAALGSWRAAENPALDPKRLRARRRARRQLRVAAAAALLLCVVAGGAGGWWLRAARDPAELPMGDALHAHRMFVLDDALRADVTPTNAADMQAWLDRQLASPPRLPDLAAAGFHPIGGRLLVTAQGPAAMVLYRDGQGGAISFYARPHTPRGPLARGQRREGPLVAHYGSSARYSVALVSRAGGRDAEVARRALRGPG